jgi:hypothetical protein
VKVPNPMVSAEAVTVTRAEFPRDWPVLTPSERHVCCSISSRSTMLIRTCPRLVFHDHDISFTAAMRVAGRLIRQTICGVGGHEYSKKSAGNRIFLQCTTCGHETPGWRIDVAIRGPKAVAGSALDAPRTAVQVRERTEVTQRAA